MMASSIRYFVLSFCMVVATTTRTRTACQAFTTAPLAMPKQLPISYNSKLTHSRLFVETITPTSIATDQVDEAVQNQQQQQQQQQDDEEAQTVVTIRNAQTDQTVVLIGTAHLSEKSNDQVQRLIERLQPNAVMIEIDESRLERLGLDKGIGDIKGVSKVTSSEDIELPEYISEQVSNPLIEMVQTTLISLFSELARFGLTQMYKSAESSLDQKAGGEFLMAIQAAEACANCDTLILGDRNSVLTLQRVAQLALESGDFFGVLNRLQSVNQAEIEALEPIVKKDLLKQKNITHLEFPSEYQLDEAELTKAMIERLKEDKSFRTRLFSKLETDVPEFTQAFLKERDYLMSESIVRELKKNSPNETKSKTIVGVVGLAHVPGMEAHIKAVFNNQPTPLVQDIAEKAAAAKAASE